MSQLLYGKYVDLWRKSRGAIAASLPSDAACEQFLNDQSMLSREEFDATINSLTAAERDSLTVQLNSGISEHSELAERLRETIATQIGL